MCYQSLQTIPDMHIARLKELFGDRLTFWGGVATELLVAGTPDEAGPVPGAAQISPRLNRGRPLAWVTEATTEGGEGIGGLHTSFDVGELVGNSDPAEQRRPVLM